MNQYDSHVSSLGFKVRAYLFNNIKDCIEIPDVKAKVVGYGFGTGYKDLICTMLVSKKGIKIGFDRCNP